MHIFWKILLGMAVLLLILAGGHGYRTLKSADEEARASWSEVLNQYQQRENLTPYLINTAQINFSQEQRYVWMGVSDAVLQVKPIQAVGMELLDDPDAFARYQAAQAALTQALSRLMSVAESDPQLKSNTGFMSLGLQLASAEGRIAAVRAAYAKAVRAYNAAVLSNCLTVKLFGYHAMPAFAVEGI